MPGSFSPIPEVQVGAVAYLFGITNTGTPISIEFGVAGVAGSAQSVELDSDDVSYTWKEKENLDTTGNVQNIVQTNFKYDRTIKLFPSGTTRAAAANVADSVLTISSLVIANYKVPSFNGNWRVKPGTKVNLKMDDNATVDISAEKYANNAQNTALTGVPIAG